MPGPIGGIVRTRLAALLVISAIAGAAVLAQQGPAGIAPRRLTEPSYVFDAAEGQKLRVVVVASGLAHPFSVAPMPNGDALVALRGGQLQVVRNAGGAGGKVASLDPQPVAGVPQVVPAYRLGGLH